TAEGDPRHRECLAGAAGHLPRKHPRERREGGRGRSWRAWTCNNRAGDPNMFVSAEVRWFWKDTAPPSLDEWFHGGAYRPGGGTPRTDEYLLSWGQRELGAKRRGGTGEIAVKGLVERGPPSATAFGARVQVWCTSTSQGLRID